MQSISTKIEMEECWSMDQRFGLTETHSGSRMRWKARGSHRLLLTGTATSGCVFATAMGAIPRGYYPVIVTDCVDPDQKTLNLMEGRFPKYGSDEIMRVWKQISGTSNRLSGSRQPEGSR